MNKKGKNKKGKIPNPIPSQEGKSSDQTEDVGKSSDKIEDVGIGGVKREVVGIISENIQNVEEKGEIVKEERVPEIVSEIIKPPVDIKDEETPKKPKRNRGKKKKGKDDDDFEDNFEEKQNESDVQQIAEETKVDNLEVNIKLEELPPITPTARKKKNKKKTTEQKTEEPILPEQELLNIPFEAATNKTELIESVEDTMQEFLKTEIMEHEVKSSKKKNKKKKRNDSERSDKEEFSCTAAFQKVLDDKKELPETKMEGKVEESITSLKSQMVVVSEAEIQLEQNKENLPVGPMADKSLTSSKDEGEAFVVEGRGKKKNKKDKKHIPKSEEKVNQEEPRTEEPLALLDTELPVQPIMPEQAEIATNLQEITQDIALTESHQPVVEDLSPKSKSKIAKPVEKKRKGKHEIQPVESMPSETIKVEEDLSEVKAKTSETKITELEISSGIESKTIQRETKITQQEIGSGNSLRIFQPEISSNITLMAADILDEEEKLAQEFELLAEKAMGKKRKKGPKNSKTLDISSKLEDIKMESDIKQTEITDDIKKEQLPVITEILTPQPDHLEFSMMSEMSDIAKPVDTLTDPKNKTKSTESIEFHGKVTLENKAEAKDITKKETSPQTDQKTETKGGKKRKKSPKSPKKTEAVHIEEQSVTSKTKEIAKEISKSELITKQSLGEKTDSSNTTRMYDIEISSIKADESEGSACDLIPDVMYPRASSQQSTDDNNNTVIREIFPVEETMLDTPIIEIKESPKIEIVKKEKDGSEIALKEEKTDLKSKMMEVNQDMEELRLSIERSLAELTSIEKSEESFEKEFEATRSQAERVSNLLFDTHEVSVMQTSDCKEKANEKVMDISSDKALNDVEMAAVSKMMPGDTTKGNITLEDKIKTITSKAEQKIEAPKIISKFEDFMPSFASISTATPILVVEENPVVSVGDITPGDNKSIIEEQKVKESLTLSMPFPVVQEKKIEKMEIEKEDIEEKQKEQITETATDIPPVCPARKDNKGKHKKKKGKQETQIATSIQSTPTIDQSQATQESKKEEKTESKNETKDSKDKSESKEKGKQQSSNLDTSKQEETVTDTDYEPIENFEDALTSSIDDVNKTFEMIVKESQEQSNPKINIIAPDEEKTPVTPPKNLLGHPDIPVRSNRRDYKKEKNKIPNEITARVKIKDSVEVETKQSKNTQTITKMKEFSKDYKMNDNDEFVYKYSFRKVFLQSSCHVCKKNLSGSRVPCSYCNLLFYCSNKHKDEDWPQHQALCFAVSTIGHLKDQKHIYADAKNLIGHDYRLIRMQMIVSCEKVLKRRLVPWEQEALLYPRMCAHVPCREWRQSKLTDCQGCGQISFCSDNADHFPKSHSRWCKSYSLYEKLVCYQQTKGRLEPKLPTKVLQEPQQIPEKINEILASMYEEKIDISDIQYAALTQLATAPLTAAYCHQLCRNKLGDLTNGVYKKSTFTIHVVGAELQFEADVLNKWEVFFLHLRPDVQELTVVLINDNLNPSNLPLELLGKIKLCENCRQNKRRVVFNFQDKKTYNNYKFSEDFVIPDIVCAFNPSIQRSSVYNGKDPWPTTINAVLKLKVPFIITAYTITELQKDCIRIKECSEIGYNFIAEPKYNNFASVRPDRNFISDDEMPLLFKNYCFAVISG